MNFSPEGHTVTNFMGRNVLGFRFIHDLLLIIILNVSPFT